MYRNRPGSTRLRGVRRLLFGFGAAALTVLVTATPAAAVPAVDPYPPYVDPGCLSFVEQPGVREFRDMIMSRVGGGNSGIFACSGFEHGEGRAWDWTRNANDPAQAASVQTVLDWLLATDAQGNPHAMARRLGIGNIIWNRRSISLWSNRNQKTWNPYSCDGTPSDCHTNHVHFAFSWQGARRQTTWFTTPDRPGDWYPGGSGGTASYSLVGDWNNDRIDTPAVVVREGSVWRWYLRNTNTGGVSDVSFTYGDVGMTPIAGDWNGDGTDTPGMVGREGSVLRWYLRNTNTGGVSDVSFTYGDVGMTPIAGDWNGDRTDTPGAVIDEGSVRRWYLRDTNTGGVSDVSFTYGNAGVLPLAGDWNGDRTDTPAVVHNEGSVRRWHLRNTNTGGVGDVTFTYGNAS